MVLGMSVTGVGRADRLTRMHVRSGTSSNAIRCPNVVLSPGLSSANTGVAARVGLRSGWLRACRLTSA